MKNWERYPTTPFSAVSHLHPTGKCGLRDYGHPGQIGLEKTPEEYVQTMVEVFRDVRRVLKKDGTLWLNLGDSYWGGKGQSAQAWSTEHLDRTTLQKKQHQITGMGQTRPQDGKHETIKPKDLVGIPWMVAFALRYDGWWLRSDIIWHKKNPMPESVKDRPTRAHEYIFLLTKSDRYYYDADAIKEPATESSIKRISQPTFDEQTGGEKDYGLGLNTNRSARKSLENFKKKAVKFGGNKAPGYGTRVHSGKDWNPMKNLQSDGQTPNTIHKRRAEGQSDIQYPMANKRDVWTVTTKPFSGAHFATFPPDLIEPCIRAGSKEGDWVIDPFAGSGTTLEVSERLGRNSVGIELNEKYVKEIVEPRLEKIQPLFRLAGNG